jgi:lipopolysaccharide export system ATP-binding protein
MMQEDVVSQAMRAMAAEKSAAVDVSSKKEPDLTAKGLVKIYGDRTVVNGMDVSCSCGEIVGLLGPNGAGKTTTFYMVVGLVRPNYGKVVFRGEDITNDPVYKRARKGLGYLAQEPSIFRKLSVWNNVMAILETLPLSAKERKARAKELLEPFDLMKVADQPAYTLSGGERRKLEIARALVRNPAILMLDEPFAGVDPLSVNEIQDIIRRLAKKGLGIIITDHNVRETLSVVDRAYMVYNGRLLKEGTTEELIKDDDVRSRYLGEDFRM